MSNMKRQNAVILARNKQVGTAGRKSSCWCCCLNSYDMTVSKKLKLIKLRSDIFGPFQGGAQQFQAHRFKLSCREREPFHFKRKPSHRSLLCFNWTFLSVLMSTIAQLDKRLHAERNVSGLGKESRDMPSTAQSKSADTKQAWGTPRLITMQHSCCFNKTFPLRRNN